MSESSLQLIFTTGYACSCGAWVMFGAAHICFQYPYPLQPIHAATSSPTTPQPCPSCGYCPTCGRKNG